MYDMSYMFRNAPEFNQPLSNWTVSNAMYMSGMFQGATTFNQHIDDWDTSNVLWMEQMFLSVS